MVDDSIAGDAIVGPLAVPVARQLANEAFFAEWPGRGG